MEQYFKQPVRSDEPTLKISATDHICCSGSPTGWSERRTSRWAGAGVLAMTLGALAIGLVDSSHTRPASAVRTTAIPATPPPAAHSSAPTAEATRRGTMQIARSQSPVALIENRGRMASRVSYDVQGRETILSFTPQGLTLTLTGSSFSPGIAQKITWNRWPIAREQATVPSRWVGALNFVGSNSAAIPQWQESTPATIRPSTDSQPAEKTRRPASATLHYRDVWPGIDLLYTITGDRLRSTFVVKPGADPNQIQFAYQNVTTIRRTEAGQLEVSTPVGSFAEEMPVAYQESHYLARLARLRDNVYGEMPGVYQERDGQRVPVAVAYTLQPSGNSSVWGIHVEAYDPHIPLIIDRVIRYPGSIGGSDTDMDPGLVADRDRAAYAIASSSSPIPFTP